MECVFVLYILAGLCIMWADRDKKPAVVKKAEKGNVIYINFPGKKVI